MDPRIEKLEEITKKASSGADLANDYYHIQRVLGIAEYLCREEKADFNIVKIAVLLHNIVPRKRENESITDYRSESIQKSEEILKKLGFIPEIISKVLNCIMASYMGVELLAENIEARVAHDANKLDTIGAIGIARAFTFGGYFNRPIYDSEKTLVKSTKDLETDELRYDPRKLEPDTVSHFKTKLLKIKDRMLTETGKKLAKDRHQFMVEFLTRFLNDIKLQEV